MVVFVLIIAFIVFVDCAFLFTSVSRQWALRSQTGVSGSPLSRLSLRSSLDKRSSPVLLVNQTFEELYRDSLPFWLIDKASSCGWTYPTAIQKKALDAILSLTEDGQPQDVVFQAETGSGKTLAYLLPCLSGVDASRAAVQVLVVVPTRELGLQVATVAKKLASASPRDKLMVMNVLQGSQNKRQRAWAWAEPPHIIIGTPEELCSMISLGGIKRYNSISKVVVDEVDACLLNNAGSMSFTHLQSSTLHEMLSRYLSPSFADSREVMNDWSINRVTQPQQNRVDPGLTKRPVYQQRQTIFCSATIPQPRHFLRQCRQNNWMIRKPVFVGLRNEQSLLPVTLDHSYLVCANEQRKYVALKCLLRKLKNHSSSYAENKRKSHGTKVQTEKKAKAIVFCDPNRPLFEMAQRISQDMLPLFWRDEVDDQILQEEGSDIETIVSILTLDDSLSQRASSLSALRGEEAFHQRNEVQEVSSKYGVATQPNQPPRMRILFSTDLAARGLDIENITHVINYDLPMNADMYLHRSGRTGRFGRKGSVISIIPPEQEFVLKRLLNRLSVEAKCLGRQKSSGMGISYESFSKRTNWKFLHQLVLRIKWSWNVV